MNKAVAERCNRSAWGSRMDRGCPHIHPTMGWVGGHTPSSFRASGTLILTPLAMTSTPTLGFGKRSALSAGSVSEPQPKTNLILCLSIESRKRPRRPVGVLDGRNVNTVLMIFCDIRD